VRLGVLHKTKQCLMSRRQCPRTQVAKSMAESEAMQAVIDALGRERIAQMESQYGTKTVYRRILREYAGLDPIVDPE
jgi:hypothetical protein